MIRRVFLNQHNVITLDSDMFGSRKRLSTGKRKDRRLISWYEKHFDEEYTKLYNEKFKPEDDQIVDTTLEKYGAMVLKLTSINRSAKTQIEVVKLFNNICNFVSSVSRRRFGDFMLSEIKSTHIMMWQMECGYSYQSIRNHRTYLNLVLKTAVNDDIIRKNPVFTVKLPPKKTVRKKIFYGEAEVKLLIRSAQGQFKNYLQLCAFSGLRGSEMVALRWDDIDFEKEVVRVDSRIRDGNEDTTKSKKVRYVPMFRQAKDALLQQRMRTGLSEFVFLDKRGKSYYGPASMTRMFKSVCEKAKVEVGSIHDLRRSFNTLLKQYGYPTDWILDIMGHVDDAVNRAHYTGKLSVDMTKLGKIIV